MTLCYHKVAEQTIPFQYGFNFPRGELAVEVPHEYNITALPLRAIVSLRAAAAGGPKAGYACARTFLFMGFRRCFLTNVHVVVIAAREGDNDLVGCWT